MIGADCDIDIGVSTGVRPFEINISLTKSDTHEGAEGPMLGAIAALGGLVASIGTDTAEFSRRLKKRPRNVDIEASAQSASLGEADEIDPSKGFTSKQFYHLAYRMAVKSYEKDPIQNFRKPRSRPGIEAMRKAVAEKRAKGGRGYQITSATAHYAYDLAATGARGKLLKVDWRYLLTTPDSSSRTFLQRSERIPEHAVVSHPQRPGQAER